MFQMETELKIDVLILVSEEKLVGMIGYEGRRTWCVKDSGVFYYWYLYLTEDGIQPKWKGLFSVRKNRIIGWDNDIILLQLLRLSMNVPSQIVNITYKSRRKLMKKKLGIKNVANGTERNWKCWSYKKNVRMNLGAVLSSM